MKHLNDFKLNEDFFIGDSDKVIGFDELLKKIIIYQNDRYDDTYVKKSKYELIEFYALNSNPLYRKIPNINKMFSKFFGSEIDKKLLSQ